MRAFKLQKEQIEFLRKMYPDNPVVQKVLSCENNGTFTVDADTKIDFMEFIEDESVFRMSEDYNATKETIILESIRDDVYYQTN